MLVFLFQAEDGIRDLVRSRGLGDVYKRQQHHRLAAEADRSSHANQKIEMLRTKAMGPSHTRTCLLYTSDAADERSSVDLGGRRIIKKKIKVRESDRSRRSMNNADLWKTATKY
mgnify:CR=1 FL=1